MSMLGPYFLDYDVNGRPTRRPDFPPGNRSLFPRIAPHNTYRCTGQDQLGQDRWCFIACETEAQWEALCRVMGREDLSRDPLFSSNAVRVEHEDELDEIIGEWTGGAAPLRCYEAVPGCRHHRGRRAKWGRPGRVRLATPRTGSVPDCRSSRNRPMGLRRVPGQAIPDASEVAAGRPSLP